MNRIEKAILIALANNLRSAGFLPVAVWTDEDYYGFKAGKMTEIPHTVKAPEPMDNDQLAEIFDAIDMYAPTIHFTHKDKTTWGNQGVMVVPGNGVDFISDYHSGDLSFEAILDQVSAAASEGALTLDVK